jgi:hypothetical protein
MTLENEREINVGDTHQHSTHVLSIQEDIDGINELHLDECY